MTDPLSPFATAAGIAVAFRKGAVSATEIAAAAIARAGADAHNAVTATTVDRALDEAAALDRARAAGAAPGPLAAVPFAAKNLFDIAGLTTRAGAALTEGDPPAARDADLVARLSAAGGLCLGALHMGEFAYDFTGENAHDGPCRNPHDPDRMSGGSSSGCGAATAAGLAPVTLGSDTNGSIRVPASLCGVFSLKPTYGRLPRGGTWPFVDSLDHLGPFARTAEDLTLAYDALQGPSPRDHAAAARRLEPAHPGLGTAAPVRAGIVGGWLEAQCGDTALARRARLVAGLDGGAVTVAPDLAEAGRASAYLITNAESAALHLPRLREAAERYDPDTRDRFLAGALLPAAWVHAAQRVRRAWLAEALELFRRVDVLILPATPVTAPRIGDRALELDGRTLPLRPMLGLLAQPFSCIGLPVVTVPVFRPGEMPLGMQLIGPPWSEARLLALAHRLEADGLATAHPPPARQRAAAPQDAGAA